MTKSRAFTLAACGLGGLFLFLWLWAGAKSGWFGFEDLWRREEPSWQFSYASTWDPAEGVLPGALHRLGPRPGGGAPDRGPPCDGN